MDIDNDGFSTVANFRGYNWRGKDCDDFSSAIYPGRKSFDGVNNKAADHDCNGVFGINKETGKYYEEELVKHNFSLFIQLFLNQLDDAISVNDNYVLCFAVW